MNVYLLSSLLFYWGGATIKQQRRDLTGRAGGARADDNFTKKPQKKLIRYMSLFEGYNTNR